MPRQTQRRMARMPQITETTPAPAGGTASNAPDVTDASNQPQTQTTPPRPNKTSLILALAITCLLGACGFGTAPDAERLALDPLTLERTGKPNDFLVSVAGRLKPESRVLCLGEGEGRSKKRAERAAAREAYIALTGEAGEAVEGEE